ncbi:MAG: hypothetical protein P1P65_04260 [Treponema sp.]
MKKHLTVLLCICVFVTGLYGQVSSDIFDPFYEDVSIWEGAGLIHDAPFIRPYPLQEVKRLLNVVIEKGDMGQRRRAEEYYKRYFGRPLHFGGKAEIAVKAPKRQFELNILPSMDVNFSLHNLLTVTGRISAAVTNKLTHQALVPEFQYSKYDLADDSVHVGPFYLLPVFNTGVAVGTPHYYVTAGIARTSYGPFYENSLLVGSHAMHQGQFSFVINHEKWTYNQAFLTLTATDDAGGNRQPGKFMMIHSLNIRPFSWLSFGIVDSIIYGKRFEPIYLIPFSAFFISQGLYDFPDNSLIGGTFTVKPIKNLRIDGVLYADDLGFNEIVKFKKDAKWRMSGQFGLSYTMPKTHWFSFIDLNYTFITPYAYTHYDHHTISRPNYSNYTHNGVPFGSNLEPNSDRIQLRLKFRPLHGLDINFSNAFIRHANITESVTDIAMLKDYVSKNYTTDGSTLNHAAITEPRNDGSRYKDQAFLYSTPFMKQKTIQYVNQLGLDVSCHLPIVKSGGYMLFKIGYTFEANINPGVGKNIYRPNDRTKGWYEQSIKDIGGAAVIKDEADKQLADWRSAARGKQFNHYIRLSAEFAY